MDFETTKKENDTKSTRRYKFDPMDFETFGLERSRRKIILYKFDPMDFETPFVRQAGANSPRINLILWILKQIKITTFYRAKLSINLILWILKPSKFGREGVKLLV